MTTYDNLQQEQLESKNRLERIKKKQLYELRRNQVQLLGERAMPWLGYVSAASLFFLSRDSDYETAANIVAGAIGFMSFLAHTSHSYDSRIHSRQCHIDYLNEDVRELEHRIKKIENSL